MAEGADPRLTPARPDLAADWLAGRVSAERYAPAKRLVAATATAPVTATPDADAPMTTELLCGEGFDAYETGPSWVWGQGEDGYVGYAPAACFAPEAARRDTRISTLTAHVYPEPDIKTRPIAALPFAARVAAGSAEKGFRPLAQGGWVVEAHLAPAADPEPDWVTVAERFLGAPYLWGGRSAAGIDCSGLVQIARAAAGLPCLRDSDMQEAAPGRTPKRLRRGDLVFWKGHVGVMTSPTLLLHANAHHMTVVREPLAEAEARIAAKGGGRPTAFRRWR